MQEGDYPDEGEEDVLSGAARPLPCMRALTSSEEPSKSAASVPFEFFRSPVPTAEQPMRVSRREGGPCERACVCVFAWAPGRGRADVIRLLLRPRVEVNGRSQARAVRTLAALEGEHRVAALAKIDKEGEATPSTTSP